MGRPRGSKNKDKRAFRDRIKAYCEEIGVDPHEFMAKTIANRRAKFEMRVLCAKELAQYLEPKLRAVELSGNPDKPIMVVDPEARKARINALLQKRDISDLGYEPVEPERPEESVG